MSENLKCLERVAPRLIGEPADINGSGITGDYVSFKNYSRCLILIVAGDGSAGGDLGVKLYQATDVSGTDAKVLNALETGRIYTMNGADYATLAALTVLTKETQATADEAWCDTDSGENVNILWAEIRADDLDVENGFDCMRCDIDDPGAAKVVAGFYLMMDPKYACAPELMPDPLVD